jgi:hypothetical protein
MTVRRGDSWEPKPGRIGDLIATFKEMKSAVANYDVEAFRLMRINAGSGGPGNLGAGSFYTNVDFASAEAYGEYMEAVRSDETVQNLWAELFSESSPAIQRGCGLLRLTIRDGAPPPGPEGAVTFVRAWRIEPDAEERARAAGLVARKHFEPLGGHRLVFRPMLPNDSGANIITSISFPGWAALGAFLDKLDNEPELLEIRSQGTAPDSGVRNIGAFIAITVAT